MRRRRFQHGSQFRGAGLQLRRNEGMTMIPGERRRVGMPVVIHLIGRRPADLRVFQHQDLDAVKSVACVKVVERPTAGGVFDGIE